MSSSSLQPMLLRSAQFQPAHVQAAVLTTHVQHCRELAERGFCDGFFAEDMKRFCPKRICATATATVDDLQRQHREWAQLSLYDFKHLNPAHCRTGDALERHNDPRARCSDPTDVNRIRERGWAVLRNMVPLDELEAMVAHVHGIAEPARSMCGAGGFQPRACFLQPGGWASQWPRFHGRLVELLERWLSSGFADEAELGWPLRPLGGTFISINRWRRTRSPTCTFRALFLAARAQPDAARDKCLAAARCPMITAGGGASGSASAESAAAAPEPPSDHDHRAACLGCWWKSVTRLPAPTIRAVAAAPPRCAAARLWPSEMRWLSHFTYGEASQNPAPYVTEMHGWLAIRLNDTTHFQGFHNWHQDGPHDLGRNHKAFVMIRKNGTSGRGDADAAARTNLIAVPADARYAHNCVVKDGQSWEPTQLQCEVALEPGDVLFFREDIHHRTQDALLDRLALIVDVLRLPLRSTPVARPGQPEATKERLTPGFATVDRFAHDMHTDVQRLNKGEGGGQWGCSLRTTDAKGAVRCRR